MRQNLQVRCVCLALGLLLTAPAGAQPEAEEPRAELMDDTPAFVSIGEGPTLAMLSGGPGFRGRLMSGLGEAIGADRRVLLIDQRGTGASAGMPLTPEAMTIDGAVADLDRVRIASGAEAWTLVGHSWGGLLAMAYAAAHPDRVDALVLVAPAGIDSSFWGVYQRNLVSGLDQETMAALGQLRPTEATAEAMHTVMRESNRLLAGAMTASDEAADELREVWLSEAEFFPAATMAMQPSLMGYDFRLDLETFDAPVLIIGGDADAIGRETFERIRDSLPNARLEILEQCGHWPMLEKPDTLSERITAFLAELDQAERSGE